MKIFVIFFALQIFSVLGQTWVSRARLRDFQDYFVSTSQQLILEVEKREWCNLKLNNHTSALNQHMYEWHVAGNATYANGFVISIQRIDLSNIESLVLGSTVNGTVEATGTVRGRINFRDVTVGFDVLFDQNNGSSHRYTGAFNYTMVDFQVSISKNFNTNQMTTSISSISFRPASPRMIYLPANNITEVLSRTFVPSSHAISGRMWATEIMQPILHKIVTTKVEFPGVCFVNC